VIIEELGLVKRNEYLTKKSQSRPAGIPRDLAGIYHKILFLSSLMGFVTKEKN